MDIQADVKRVPIRKGAEMVDVEIDVDGKNLFVVQYIELVR